MKKQGEGKKKKGKEGRRQKTHQSFLATVSGEKRWKREGGGGEKKGSRGGGSKLDLQYSVDKCRVEGKRGEKGKGEEEATLRTGSATSPLSSTGLTKRGEGKKKREGKKNSLLFYISVDLQRRQPQYVGGVQKKGKEREKKKGKGKSGEVDHDFC